VLAALKCRITVDLGVGLAGVMDFFDLFHDKFLTGDVGEGDT
jgi:hypothetical protein